MNRLVTDPMSNKKSNKSNKGSWSTTYILIGLLVMSLLFGAYYFRTQKNNADPTLQSPRNVAGTTEPAIISADDTSNWKTYTNNKFKITFSYPDSYIATEQTENEVFLSKTVDEKRVLEDCLAKNQPDCNNYSLKIGFAKLDKGQDTTLTNFVTAYTKSDSSDYTVTFVSGRPALLRQSEGMGTVNVFIDQGETVFSIQGNSVLNPEENMENFKRILTTIKIEPD